jgi:hypothetical protein
MQVIEPSTGAGSHWPHAGASGGGANEVAEVPDLGLDSAMQMIAELEAPQAANFQTGMDRD